jgi:3-oxoacyl-[acyl-carrier protein] reductase
MSRLRESWPGTMHNVVVTGGSRGIGLAIVRRLAAAGYNVIAVARHESDELRAAIAEVRAGRCGLHFRAFDLSDTEAIPDFVKRLRDEFGAIYGLVNNAGIGPEGLLATQHNSEIEALVRLNVLSPIILTKYIVRHMMADGAGRIVNMSSIIATTGYNGLSVYGATKAAATGFTRSLAREVGKLGITVNAIAPGFVDTELTQGLSDDQRKRIAGRSALRRLPDADDVARMVEYLLGDGGRNITGSVLTVDAGNTA